MKESSTTYWALVLNVLVATFMAVLSAAATIIVEDSIQGELALSDPQATWLTTLYLLGINTTVPVANWFADHFGYKKLYAIGVAVFTLSSGLIAIAFNFPVIAIARFIEGVGAGLIFPIGLALVAQNTPKEKLSMGLSLYVAAAFGGGFALGFPIAGYFAEFQSWRECFALMVPFGTAALFFCWWLQKETALKKQETPFDFFGYVSFALFIASLLVALTHGPLASTDAGWRSPFILSCFALAGLCLIATIYFESRHPDPILLLALFKDPLFTMSVLTMFLLGMSIFASASVTIHYMLQALNYEKFIAGKLAIVYGLMLTIFSILSHLLIRWVPVALLSFFGLSLLVLSYYLNQFLDWTTGPEQILAILSLRGIALGLTLGPVTIQAMHNIPKELSNKAATLLTFFRQVGGTYGGTLISIISIKRAIFHSQRFSEQAHAQLPGYQTVYQKILSDFSGNVLQAKGAIVQNLQRQAYITGLSDALLVFGMVTAAATLILLFLNLRHLVAKD